MASSNRIRLGRSELQVSPVCYGTWQLSPSFWGKLPEDKIVDAIRMAFDQDINFYDTADAYGEGYAETVLGQAVKSIPRDQIIIATKAYHHFYTDGTERHPDLSSAHIRQACDDSLKRLDMDYIDLYQCHAYDPLAHTKDIAATLDDLVKAGKIRAYGMSNWSAEQMRTGHAFGNFATSQPRYSLLAREIETDVLPYCLGSDMGTLVYSSLHLGLLTGKYKGQETFEDLRKNQADFQGQRFKTICDRVAEVGQLARKYDLTTVQMVLAVTLMHPGITSAIVGIKTPEQIKEAAGAMGKTVSIPDANKVRSLLTVN